MILAGFCGLLTWAVDVALFGDGLAISMLEWKSHLYLCALYRRSYGESRFGPMLLVCVWRDVLAA